MAQHRRTIALVTSAHMSQSRGQVAYPYGIHRLVAALAGHAQRLLICAPTIEGTASEHETTGDPGGNVELCPLPSFRHQWSAFAHAPAILSQYACVCRACQVLIIRGICPFVAILYLLAWWYRCQVCHLCISDNMAIVRAHRRRGVVLDWLACGFVWQDTLARRWGRWLTDGTLACFGTEIARLYPSPRTEVVVSSAVVEEDIVTRLDTCRQGAVQLLFVGVVRPEKGVHTLLEALPLLRTSRSWHLTIAGPFSAYPNYRKELDRLIAERGLDGHVSWRGPIAHGVPLYELMRASDIFVLPSLTEGTPHVISEARAQGLPVIASRVGGIPDMVSDGVDGLLVPPEEPAPLAQAIGRILEDGALRRSLICAGFSTVRNHTVDRLAARLLEFIHS